MRHLFTFACLLFTGMLSAQDKGYTDQYDPFFDAPPSKLPTAKTPDAPLAGNGDIGLTMGGAPDSLTFYLGKNDFWRAYPVYPGGGIALPGGLSILIPGLKDAAYHARQAMEKGAIFSVFGKDSLQMTMHAWVAATHNIVVIECLSSERIQARLRLWAQQGNTSVTDAGTTNGVHWVTRSFENTPLLEWPCHIAIAMKVLGATISKDDKIDIPAGQRVTITLTAYTNFDRKDWKLSAINEALTYYIDLVDNYDEPLLDYMAKGREHARDLLNVRGIYYPVGIGPKGLVTTRWPLTPDEMMARYGTREDTIDHGYKFLGQKINAVFGAGNMLMRFYSTYDRKYAAKVYPYLLACADFWEDYLQFVDGRYMIYMDHFNEIMPNLRTRGQWRDRLGDVNSTLSLGLVKMLFHGMLDVSTYLQVDAGRRQKWEHILTHLSPFPLGTADGRPSLKNMEKGPQGKDIAPAGLNRVSIHGLILPGGVAGPCTDSAFNKILLGDVAAWKARMKSPGEWGNTLGNGIETCFPGAVRVGYDPAEIIGQLKDRIAIQSLRNLWITQGGGGIETLAAVPLTINEMLMQSYEGVLRLFPDWDRTQDAAFDKLRAYGAFLVSSRLRNGEIDLIKLVSEKGRTCIMENPWPGKKLQLWRNDRKAEVLTGTRVHFPTKEKEVIRLTVYKSV